MDRKEPLRERNSSWYGLQSTAQDPQTTLKCLYSQNKQLFCYKPRSWDSSINRNWWEARKEIQARLYKCPCSLSEEGNWFLKRDEGSGRLVALIGGVASVACPPPWWCCVQGSHAVSGFCSLRFRNGSWFVALLYLWFIIAPTAVSVQLFLVPCSFLVLCC